MSSILAALAAVALSQGTGNFASDHPKSSRFAAADGRLTHASGFLVETGAVGAEGSARAFLSRYSDDFGIGTSELVLMGEPRLGTSGPVKFSRLLNGMPVFDGDITVGVDEKLRVFLVNASTAPNAPEGSHKIGESAAHEAALRALGPNVEGAQMGSIVEGYRTFLGTTRAVYRVDFIASKPAGDWRSYVDGETGTVLLRQDLRSYASAPGSVYEISPVEDLSGLCPIGASGGRTLCKNPIPETFVDLVDGTNLIGSQTSVYNCDGINAPSTPAGVPGTCAKIPALADMSFDFQLDTTFKSLTDSFAGGMAYWHLDKHVTFFLTLDPNLPPTSATATGGMSRALRGSLPGLVNNKQGGAPLENAFFSGALDAMVFGQGATADYAYDATVMYHEFTHGVVFAWGGYNSDLDAMGALEEPSAVNEGTADSMAVSETGHSAIGGFITSLSSPATPSLRDMNDPTAQRSCHGNGSTVTQLGQSGVNNGFDGEVHDDGEIWNGMYWEIFDGLRSTGFKGCSGACEAGPELMYKTLELAAGAQPTFATYWQTFKSAATVLHPDQPSVAAYVDCVAKRRGMDQCDRTVPMYGGEIKVQFIRSRYSPYQVHLHVTGPAEIQVCSLSGVESELYARKGSPVQLSGIDPTSGNATITADFNGGFNNTCDSPAIYDFDMNDVGEWYLLVDSAPGSTQGAEPSLPQAVYGYLACAAGAACAPSAGLPARPAAPAPATCTPPAELLITSTTLTTPPRGMLTLTSSGGTGTGNAWTISTNHSGGTIVAGTGVYTAGATPNVTDTVSLADSLVDTASVAITVTAGVSVAPASVSLMGGTRQTFTASGGSGTGFLWSLATNASGGSIDSTGHYTAGTTAGADVVKATDSLGNIGTAAVTVTAVVNPGGGSGGGSGGGAGGGTGGGTAGGHGGSGGGSSGGTGGGTAGGTGGGSAGGSAGGAAASSGGGCATTGSAANDAVLFGAMAIGLMRLSLTRRRRAA